MAAPIVTYGLLNQYRHVAALVRGSAAGATELAGALSAMLSAGLGTAEAPSEARAAGHHAALYGGLVQDGAGGIRVTA